ncbi:MAG TPA: ATP-binding protein [Polyangiaceae bacterium]|nr:ATP-binding protein [Polyangiaceae bacterium]
MTEAKAFDALKILIVDDDEVDRMTVRRALRSQGIGAELVEASDAASALQLLRSGSIDCTFLDFYMPGHDGLWLVQQARAAGIFTPLIVLTGQGDERIAVELMKAGASDYFSKSQVTAERVAGSLRQALRVFEAETAYRQSEQHLRLAIEATQLGTWDYFPETGRFRWSDRCRSLFGVAPGDLVSYEQFLNALHPEDRERTHEAVQRALYADSGGVFDVEYRAASSEGGASRWIRATGRAFFNEQGRAVRFIGTVQDIDDRKQLESQRTRLLEAERVARQRAEEASRVRDDFMAIVSHDLRNPLSTITTGITLLQSTAKLDPTGKAQRQLDLILRSAERMAKLISDLLDMATIDEGRLVVTPSAQDAAALIQDAWDFHQLLAANKQVRLIAQKPGTALFVLADRERILQVLSNIVGNAIKFTPAGGSVTIAAEAEGARARFSISDTGPGVKPEQLPHLFDRYWQATPRAGGGIGLGLSIAKGIVDAHGGEIWVESEPGHGTTFHFRLPVMAAEPASMEAESSIPSTQVSG